MHEFLSTTPFDIYELFLFRLVVTHRSFTKAAAVAGLTQSAITRQIQGMENSLGVDLLQRTTRVVRATPAGEFLFRESARLVGHAEESVRRLRQEFAGARKEVRVGVSQSIPLAHLPGFFHANLRRQPKVSCRLSYQSSGSILAALEGGELDVGVLFPPKRLPTSLRITHRFDDAFTLIAPLAEAQTFQTLRRSRSARTHWLTQQKWLLISDNSNTGRRLRGWMNRNGWRVEPTMQLDSFDLIINLVALGFGISLVPIRGLALYGRKKMIRRLVVPDRFIRELVVVIRRNRKTPVHLQEFVENILF
ncbi:MAG: LysR family transcriptional regulator [Verrucomicrobiota bacterium]|nr:LysR family transcriptional regulator [Verrucomicrobiota bacterium]